MGVIKWHDMAVATSGHHRHRIETDGGVVPHWMNAVASAPLDKALASVTVMAASRMEADALARGTEVGGEIRAGP